MIWARYLYAALIFAGAAYCLWHLVRILKSGAVTLTTENGKPTGTYQRSTSPLTYWVSIAANVAVSLTLAAYGLYVLGVPISPLSR